MTRPSTSSFGAILKDDTGAALPRYDVPSGNDPSTLTIGDVNDDGHLDVLVAAGGDHLVAVHLGAGDGKLDFVLDHTGGIRLYRN